MVRFEIVWTIPHRVLHASLAARTKVYNMCNATFTWPNDCVRFYHCGGGIKNWQPGDVPVAEHAIWFPTCELIRDVINRNAVIVEDETRGACGGPEKDVNFKDFTTSENENLTATSDNHNIQLFLQFKLSKKAN